MKAVEVNNRLIHAYLALLKKLDTDSKLDLIKKLTESVKTDKTKNRSSFQDAFGAWDSSDDAEKIIEEIRSSSVFNREIEGM